MAAKGLVQSKESLVIPEVHKAVHDPLDLLLPGDPVLHHLFHQLTVLLVCGIHQAGEPLDGFTDCGKASLPFRFFFLCHRMLSPDRSCGAASTLWKRKCIRSMRLLICQWPQNQ